MSLTGESIRASFIPIVEVDHSPDQCEVAPTPLTIAWNRTVSIIQARSKNCLTQSILFGTVYFLISQLKGGSVYGRDSESLALAFGRIAMGN
jgi:hypothetical protein